MRERWRMEMEEGRWKMGEQALLPAHPEEPRSEAERRLEGRAERLRLPPPAHPAISQGERPSIAEEGGDAAAGEELFAGFAEDGVDVAARQVHALHGQLDDVLDVLGGRVADGALGEGGGGEVGAVRAERSF